MGVARCVVGCRYGESLKGRDEDGSKEFFRLVSTFVRAFRQAHSENLSQRIEVEKAAAAELLLKSKPKPVVRTAAESAEALRVKGQQLPFGTKQGKRANTDTNAISTSPGAPSASTTKAGSRMATRIGNFNLKEQLHLLDQEELDASAANMTKLKKSENIFGDFKSSQQATSEQLVAEFKQKLQRRRSAAVLALFD